MLLLLWTNDVDPTPRYKLVEFFSGKAQVSEAFRQRGHMVASYDVQYGTGEEMNFLNPAGFAFLISTLPQFPLVGFQLQPPFQLYDICLIQHPSTSIL